jgi:hypothetical protein
MLLVVTTVVCLLAYTIDDLFTLKQSIAKLYVSCHFLFSDSYHYLKKLGSEYFL